MSYVENLTRRTTGFGIVAGLSVGPSLVLGLVLALAERKWGLMVGAAFFGPITALMFASPLRHLTKLVAGIPVVGLAVLPFVLIYFVTVKPAELFALHKQWVEKIEE